MRWERECEIKVLWWRGKVGKSWPQVNGWKVSMAWDTTKDHVFIHKYVSWSGTESNSNLGNGSKHQLCGNWTEASNLYYLFYPRCGPLGSLKSFSHRIEPNFLPGFIHPHSLWNTVRLSCKLTISFSKNFLFLLLAGCDWKYKNNRFILLKSLIFHLFITFKHLKLLIQELSNFIDSSLLISVRFSHHSYLSSKKVCLNYNPACLLSRAFELFR